jgi:hypothetical protein
MTLWTEHEKKVVDEALNEEDAFLSYRAVFSYEGNKSITAIIRQWRRMHTRGSSVLAKVQ